MKRTAYIIGDRKKFGADRDFEKAERHLENFFFEVFNPKFSERQTLTKRRLQRYLCSI